MEKTFQAFIPGYGNITAKNGVKTYDEAVEQAKRKLKSQGFEEAVIYESVAFIKTPVPEYEVTKIT